MIPAILDKNFQADKVDAYQGLRKAVADDFELGVIVKAGVRALLAERDALAAEVERLRADAERYRALRHMAWSDSPLAVVRNPKQAVKLGHDCPSLDRLDAAIDASREAA